MKYIDTPLTCIDMTYIEMTYIDMTYIEIPNMAFELVCQRENFRKSYKKMKNFAQFMSWYDKLSKRYSKLQNIALLLRIK